MSFYRTIAQVLIPAALVGVFALSPAPVQAQDTTQTTQVPYQATWESLDSRPNPDWFEDAKFGIFIHWGVYAVPAWSPIGKYAEWYWPELLKPDSATRKFHDAAYGPGVTYQDLAPRFKAELYDPAQWADLFVRSGARYVVLTSKHHDGFCLWPSEYSWNWNAGELGPHRDLLGDLFEAVRARDLKAGFYYSLYEWYNPLYKQDAGRYVENHMIPQLKELVQRYRPSIVWPDGEWDHPSDTWKSREFLAWLFNESPSRDDVVVNDRWGNDSREHHGGFYTTEYGYTKMSTGGKAPKKWEECRGIGGSFGYNRNETTEHYATGEALVTMLVEIVAHGGNLLLNIGPAADGTIPVIMQQRLLEMGRWLEVNGEAIYGTQPWRATTEGETVRYTSKGDKVYAISLGRPGARLVLSTPRPGTAPVVRLLGYDRPLECQAVPEGLAITIPCDAPAKANLASYPWVFELTGVQ